MKFILKLSLLALGLSIAQIDCNPQQFAKHVLKAVEIKCRNTSNPKIRLFQVRNANQPQEKLNRLIRNTNLEGRGFIFESLIEYLFDENNNDSLATHVEAISYFESLLGQNSCRVPQLTNFVTKLQAIKNSTDISQIRNTFENELKALDTALSSSNNPQLRKLAQKLKSEIDQMISKKGKFTLLSTISQRAKANRR